MKRIAPVVVVVVIFATGASSHKSGWMESFDAFGEGYSFKNDGIYGNGRRGIPGSLRHKGNPHRLSKSLAESICGPS